MSRLTEPTEKRARLGVDSDDMVVVVGKENFRESSRWLRCTSGYFDAAFRSGMKEAQEMRFEFPDKDPKEWELIRELLCPFPKIKIMEENIETVLSWFDFLSVERGLDECDRVLEGIIDGHWEAIIDDENVLSFSQHSAAGLVHGLAISTRYNLELAKESALLAVNKNFEYFPYLWDLKDLQSLGSLLASDDESFNIWWGDLHQELLEEILPGGNMQKEDWKTLCDSGLFGKVVHAGIKQRQLSEIFKLYDDKRSIGSLRAYLQEEPGTEWLLQRE